MDFGDGNSTHGRLINGAVDPLLGLRSRISTILHTYDPLSVGFPHFNATLRLCCRPVDVVNGGGLDMFLQVVVSAGPGWVDNSVCYGTPVLCEIMPQMVVLSQHRRITPSLWL